MEAVAEGRGLRREGDASARELLANKSPRGLEARS